MPRELESTMKNLNKHISEDKILSLIFREQSLNDVEYSKYSELGYAEEDIMIGLELIRVYRLLKEQYDLIR